MPQRTHEHLGEPGRARPRRSPSPLATIQREVGNRGMTQLLARKAGHNRATFEHSVQIGTLGPIEVKESNEGDWTNGKSGADDLVVTSVKGKHSDALKRMSDTKERVDKIAVQTIVGQNTWVIVTFEHGVVAGYEADPSGKTERWKLVRFDHVDIHKESIGKPRP